MEWVSEESEESRLWPGNHMEWSQRNCERPH